MKCFLWLEKKFFEVNRKEDIDSNTYLITDYEQENIRKTLESDGHLWLDSNNQIQWSGPNPSDVTIWDDTTHEWVVDQDLYNNALSLLKAKLWEDIKSYRVFKSTNGTLIPSINKWAHSDEVSQITYTRAKDYLELNPDATIDWKMMDGSFVKINFTLLKEICSKVFELGQASFINAEVHKVKINNINDLDTLKSYDIKTGWPTTFSDRS
jgi:DNA-binding transcriptional regulator YhcF (GntR family)